MNIFVLDKDPKKCAEYHIDKHVIKMPVEIAQQLSTCVRHFYQFPKQTIVMDGIKVLYKSTHKNHPCNIWLRESKHNFLWTLELGLELCKEFLYRGFGKGQNHKSIYCLNFVKDFVNNLPDVPMTKFVQAFGKYMSPKEDSIEGYREYYLLHKRFDVREKLMHKWTNRPIPHWLNYKD
jgi:hypothetical protein